LKTKCQFAVFALSLALAACGGGEGASSTVATTSSASAPPISVTTGPFAGNAPITSAQGTDAAKAFAKSAQAAVATGTTDQYGGVNPSDAISQLFAFALKNFPQYFPDSEVLQRSDPFDYSYYASTAVYLGVAHNAGTSGPFAEGGVYVMGGPFGNSPTYVGQLTQFIAPATYAAGSAQADAYAALNEARWRCGFGMLTQATAVDTAAAAHAAYMAANGAVTHFEVAGQFGFTGTTVGDRIISAGYQPSTAGEGISPQNPGGTGSTAVSELLAAPYHAAVLLGSFRDVGIGWSTVGGDPTLTIDVATKFGQPPQLPAGVATFPCAGTTGVTALSVGENPSPFPTNASAKWGQPIIVRGASNLAINSVTITGPSGSVPVLAIYGDGQTADPNNMGLFTQGMFTIIPAPLQVNSSYNVVMTYTNAGVAGQTSFTFSTGGQ